MTGPKDLVASARQLVVSRAQTLSPVMKTWSPRSQDLVTLPDTLSPCSTEMGNSQTQALSAIVFLYRHVLDQPFDWLEHLTRAKRPVRPPVVLTRGELRLVLARMHGVSRIVAGLLYGSGLRLMEACKGRQHDRDLHSCFESRPIRRCESA